MVAMYVNGEKVDTLEEAIRAIPEAAARKFPVEFRADDGRVVWQFTPVGEEPPVPWDPTITREELDRRLAGPGLQWEEAKKWMGWE